MDKEKVRRLVEEYAELVVSNMVVNKIILYGSYARGDFRKEKIAAVYELYQKRLRENNAIDFDDIINYAIKILLENPDVLEY